MTRKARFSVTSVALLLLASLPATSRPKKSKDAKDDAKNVVYVCACLKNKSCSCMTMAKTEGPCACGTEGGPPLKAVPKDSDWAKANRDALAK